MQEEPSKICRVALYARVSTDEQRDGQTIDSQIAELDRFARDKGWQITGLYKDDGWSGTILDRPELDRLRDDGSKGLFNVALVNDVDRLARDVSHLGIVKRDLLRHNVQIVFRKLPAEQSPTHNLMVNILGSFAEFERELILDRTRRGRRHKVEVRKQFPGGLAPYGFRYVPKDKSLSKDGYLEIVPAEATIVRQMFSWVDQEGLSARKIVQRLASMNAAPRKNGERWGKSSVLRILRSETYAGVWHYNKHESCEPRTPARVNRYRKSLKSSVRVRPRSDWLPLTLPQKMRLIGRDQWLRVQQQLTRNIAFSPRNSKHQYVLKGLVKCGGCSASYVGEPCHGKYYYRCSARCKKLPVIKQEYLDATVWSSIEGAILNPELIADHIEKFRASRAVMTDQRRTEQSEIAGARAELQAEEARILEAYRKSIITPEQLGVQLQQINARKAILKTRVIYISRDVGARDAAISKRSVEDWCQQAAIGLKRFTDQDRQKFIRLVVNDIVFEGERIRIRGVIPVQTSQGDSRSLDTTVRQENTYVSQSRTAGTAARRRGRSPAVSDDRIAAKAVDHHDRNPSYGFSFELVRSLLRQPPPLQERLDITVVQVLLNQRPSASLKELCDQVQSSQGFAVSITSMSRILRRIGLSYRERRIAEDRPLDSAA